MTRSSAIRKWNSGGLPEAYSYPAYAPLAPELRGSGLIRGTGRLIVGLLEAAWYVVTLPLRLVVALVGLVSRLTGIVAGFALMVVGMALCIGPLFIVGIPVFVIGLLLTMRCLG